MRKERQTYGLTVKELRAMTIEELQNEYSKWVQEEKSFKGNTSAQLICTRVQNRISKIYQEKQ